MRKRLATLITAGVLLCASAAGSAVTARELGDGPHSRPDCSGTAFRRSGIAFGRRRATRQEDPHAEAVLLRLLEAQGHKLGFLQRVLLLSRTRFGRIARARVCSPICPDVDLG